MPTTFRSLFAAIALLLASCAAAVAPVDIEKGDMCSFCRMAISEKRYAAEIITEDETVLKFDDIGCLMRYRRADAGKTSAAAIYVADSETGAWLKAEEGYFVRSNTVKTPMSSGIIAFTSQQKAGAESIRFADLDAQR